MSGDPIMIRPYRDGDEHGILDLFQRVFGKSRSLSDWQWRYVANPAGPKPSDQIIVCEQEGRIVGHYAISPSRMTYNGRAVLAGQGIDTMMDPAHRQMGLLRRSFRSAVDGMKKYSAIAYGFPTPAHYTIGRRYGYRDVGHMVPLFRRLSLRGALRRRAAWLPNLLVEAAGRLSRHWYRPCVLTPRKGDHGKFLHATTLADPRVNTLWEAFKDRYAIATVRDLPYLEWRYRQGDYTIILHERDTTLCGYAVVTAPAGPPPRTGYLVDLVYLDDPRPLVNEALRWLMEAGADHALCALLEGDPMVEAIMAMGFRPHAGFARFPLVCLPLHPDISSDYLSDPKNWHLTYSDSDAF